MRILVHDFGGYAFTLELSRALAARGHDVCHAYCASHQTTPPGTALCKDDRLTIHPLHLRRPLDKYALVKRWAQEREYGSLIARTCKDFGPDVVLSANAPLSAQQRLLAACRKVNVPLVYWLQDLIGEAAYQLLGRKLGLAGSLVGKRFKHVEAHLLRQSAAVVAISRDFVPLVRGMGVAEEHVHIIENWAPLEPKDPARHSALAQELGGHSFLLYTGTLSMKHNPALLVALAEGIRDAARVVVVSQGSGAEWLKEEKRTRSLANLTIHPYQPKHELPALYAAATVLVAVLEEEAGVFSVPSKVLTYLAAGRPLLLAVPQSNLAARIVVESGAGLVVPPKDPSGLVEAARSLLGDVSQRTNMGVAARAYAERTFAIDAIADRFESVLEQVTR